LFEEEEMTISDNALKLISRNQKVSLEIDAETYRLISELAVSAGSDIQTLLAKLSRRYNQASYLEKQIVLHFLNGV